MVQPGCPGLTSPLTASRKSRAANVPDSSRSRAALAEVVDLIQQRKARCAHRRQRIRRSAAPGRTVPAREQIIADALADVASELRLSDAAELILLIQNDHAANIADLVNSSTELFFKSGTLRYALSARFTAPWDATPVVEIDMEFRHAAVCAFFRLKIGRRRAGVEIIDILYDEQGLDDFAKAERLSAALASARVRSR
jgi:hypothetical protein